MKDAKNERTAPAWDAELIKLAAKYNASLNRGQACLWLSAEMAAVLRKMFARKSKHGESGWEQFCREVIKRNPSTVGLHMSAYEYVVQYEPSWKAKVRRNQYLPSVTLVGLLARADQGLRKELHAKLFDDSGLSASDIRARLRKADNRDAANGKDNGSSNNSAKPGKNAVNAANPDVVVDREGGCEFEAPKIVARSSKGKYVCEVRYSEGDDDDLMALLEIKNLGKYLDAGLVLKRKGGK